VMWADFAVNHGETLFQNGMQNRSQLE
jgi:hypothetical protein